MANGSKYNDVRFFLIAIACISAFNYYITYSNIHFGWFLIITYTIDTVEGWLAWWAVRSIIIYLDEKMPYENNPLKRIVIQTSTTTVAGLSIIILLTEMVSWIVRGRSALSNFYTHDIFIFIIWFLVINGIYIGLHYYHQWKELDHRREEEKKLRTGGFPVKLGKQDQVISFEQIIGFYSDEGYTYLQAKDGRKFLIDRSLDKIESSLPHAMFFRVNRQYILSHTIVSGFKRVEDGKLELMVKAIGNLPGSLQVSRNKAAGFKKWYR
jgi:DNA-binding LytR/AlgR family response regulator